MKHIYCISGLGADHRLFANLSIPGYELIPLSWLPFDKEDDMATYAMKMASLIEDKAPVILGLSFGGMLSVEIAKKYPQARVFIVSSAKLPSELQIHGGAISRWLINSMIVPPAFLTYPAASALYYLGAKTKEEKKFISQIIREADGRFMKWALKTLANWQNTVCPTNVTHIHGTADKTIPSAHVHPDYWIEDGSHIMIYNMANEVSKIITDSLLKTKSA